MEMERKRCWDVLSAEISKRMQDNSDACEFVLTIKILIKIMDKLFSLFLRYSLVPEK